MKAAIFHGPGHAISIDEMAMPVCGPDDVMIQIRRCGICGSDISMTNPDPFAFPPGRIGHEYSGEVVEVGRNVTSIRRGDRVTALTASPCGDCEGCRWGNPVFCRNPRLNADGHGGFGGFGEFVSRHHRNVVVLPQSLSFADGALIEPMACGLHALRKAHMQGGERILVIGAGSMALSVVYWARRLGAAKVAAVSRSANNQELVCALGADRMYALNEADIAEVFDFLGGPPDFVAECVGKPGLLDQAVQFVRPGGTVISMGMCMHAEPFMPAAATFKDLNLVFSVASTMDEFVATARAFDADAIRPEVMVNELIGLQELPMKLEQLRSGQGSGIKVHVDPNLVGE